MTRLALVGAGAIAEFHAPALREAGFELAAVCARPDSQRAREFAGRHGVPRVCRGVVELLDARDTWDAVVITVSTDACLGVLELVLPTSAPVLVEKPVALRSTDLEPLIGRDLPVQVGYNRRFYRTVAVARDEVRAGPPVLATLVLPESVGDDHQANMVQFLTNSVHGLDLARYVFGGLDTSHVEHTIAPDGSLQGIAATLRSPRGDIVQFVGNWGAPANYSLTIDRRGRRFELRPLELGAIYDRMEVVEPTADVPIRSYRPQLADQVTLDALDLTFKPGFVGQAEAFARLCRGDDPQPAARLEDAHAVLVLAEALLEARDASPSS